MGDLKPDGTGKSEKEDVEMDIGDDAPKDVEMKKAAAKKKAAAEADLSEEDLEIKEMITLLVERAQDPDAEVASVALRTLAKEIRESTSSMTGVPKPLKFLRPFLDELVLFLERMEVGSENRYQLADILSVLAMTKSDDPDARLCLKYKLQGKMHTDDLYVWGQEYIRFLAGEVAAEYVVRSREESSISDLERLIVMIVPFLMAHNSEPNACDLLMATDKLSDIYPFMDEGNVDRVCLYLRQCARYLDGSDGLDVLGVVFEVFRRLKRHSNAMLTAMILNDTALMSSVLEQCPDRLMKKQLCFLLARQHVNLVVEDEELSELINNAHLSKHFLALAKDLDVLEPKAPSEVYKSHVTGLQRPTISTSQVDSARSNLAATFVNALVNAAFGTDKLLMDKGSDWIFKNKDVAMISAAASQGMILLWDVEAGLPAIDRYLYSGKDEITAGALLGVGIVNCGIRNDFDPAMSLLGEHVDAQSPLLRTGANMGLGIAYAGTARDDIVELLKVTLLDKSLKVEHRAIAGLSMGLVCVASRTDEAVNSILNAVLDLNPTEVTDPMIHLMVLGLGFCLLERMEAVEPIVEKLQKMPEGVRDLFSLVVEICGHACSGRVLTIQRLLAILSDHDEANQSQAVAVLGLSLVVRGEELGEEMVVRHFDRLLQYGEVNVRRAVPLGLALLCVSNPKLAVIDTLSKLSHDADGDVARGAILALGIIGAGTNNSRIAGVLHPLADFYAKSAAHMFVIRLAQGLLHVGKGILTLDPFHSHRSLSDPRAVAALVAVLFVFFDTQSVTAKYPHLLYYLTPALHPRMLVTLDEKLEPLAVQVRVGQAVDVVGQAGQPKSLTGFQVHTTPVLIGYGERVELLNDEWIPLSPVLEGFVILVPNPDATGEER